MVKKSIKFLGILGVASVSSGVVVPLLQKNNDSAVIQKNNLINSNYSFQNYGLTSLSGVIKNANLGVVLIHSGNATESEKESVILNTLWLKNQNVDITHIKIKFGNLSNRAFVVPNGPSKYTGMVTLSFDLKVGRLSPLASLVRRTEIGSISSSELIPSDEKIKEVFKAKNSNINMNSVRIINKTHLSAIIAGDGIVYTGNVRIEFYVSSSTTLLKNILKEKRLGQILFNETTNETQLKEAIKEKNPEINVEWISIEIDDKSDSATVFGDEINYSGEVTVDFNGIIQKDIVKDLTILELGEITIEESEQDKNMFSDVIFNHIYNLYGGKNVEQEILDRIAMIVEIKDSEKLNLSSTSATLAGKDLESEFPQRLKMVYINEVTVSFTFKSVANPNATF